MSASPRKFDASIQAASADHAWAALRDIFEAGRCSQERSHAYEIALRLVARLAGQDDADGEGGGE